MTITAKKIIPCICMTCGIRNDFTNEDGLCQNQHDDWLEYRDVKSQNEFFHAYRKRLGWSAQKLTERFMNPDIKQISPNG